LRLPEFLKGNPMVLIVCECVWRSTVDIVIPFVSLYVLELSGNYQTIGFITSIASLASILLYPLGGYIADYQGRIKLIGYMTFMYGVAFLITGLGESWQWLALGMFVQSLVTFYWPAIQALTADSIPPYQRGIGYATIEAIPAAFGLIAPLTGAFLIGLLGMRTAMRGLYFSAFIITSIIALFRLRFLKETLTDPKRLDTSPRGIVKLFVDSYRGIFTTLSCITRDLWVLALLVSALVFSASFAGSFWVIRATQVIGLSLAEWATVITVSGIVGVVLGIPAGRLIDRLSKRLVAAACLIFGGVLAFLFLRVTSFYEVLVLAVAAATLDAFLNPSLKSLFADLTPRNVRGRAMALVGGGGLNLMRNVFANSILAKVFLTTGAFLSGYIYGLDNSLPWVILSGAMLVIGVCFIIFVKDPAKPEV
jgi:MFS family permease